MYLFHVCVDSFSYSEFFRTESYLKMTNIRLSLWESDYLKCWYLQASIGQFVLVSFFFLGLLPTPDTNYTLIIQFATTQVSEANSNKIWHRKMAVVLCSEFGQRSHGGPRIIYFGTTCYSKDTAQFSTYFCKCFKPDSVHYQLVLISWNMLSLKDRQV